MALTIKLSKADNQPWGFRLSGGADFGVPLTISKVNLGTVAERAGLHAGDAVVGINGHDALRMRHADAQNLVKQAGSSFDMVVTRGGSIGTGTIWKPQVTPHGDAPLTPQPMLSPALASDGLPSPGRVFTKTSLEATQHESQHIGSSHNMAPKPFGGSMHDIQDNTVKTITNRQFNSPVGLYSEESIAETLSAQAEVLASGVLGVDFKKNEKAYSGDHSEVLKMVQQMDSDPVSHHPAAEASDRPAGTSKVLPSAPVIRPPGATPTSLVRCAECDRIIDSVFVRVKDKNLHPECFKCATCGCSLRNAGYYNINNKLYCDIHARQAAKCNPPAPNMDPVTVPPGGKIPAGAVASAALAKQMVPNPPAQKFIPPAAPASPAYKPAAPAPKLKGYAAVGKPHPHAHTGGSHFVWPPPKPEEGDHVATATPAYIAPAQIEGSLITAAEASSSSVMERTSSSSITQQTSYSSVQEKHESVSTSSFAASSGSTGSATFSKVQAPVQSPVKPFTPAHVAAPVAAPAPAPILPPAPAPILPPAPAPILPPAPAPILAPAPPPPVITPVQAPAPIPSIISTPPAPAPAPPPPAPSAPGKGATAGTTQAPKRGKGVMKQPGAGPRLAICAATGQQIRGPFVLALGKCWSPEAFVCQTPTCKRNLQDIGFVEEGGKLYCENCWEQYIAPICSKCNKRVKGDCLLAIGKQFHPECFACSYCGRLFGNAPFYLEDGLPYCETDWNELFTTKCVGCGFPIEAGDRWVEALNNNYHSQCFKCTLCGKNLEGQSFYAKGDRPFCKSHARHR